MDIQVVAQANNLTGKVEELEVVLREKKGRLEDRVQESQLTEMSSPPLHSGLFRAR